MGNKNNSKLTIIDLGEDQKTTLARMASHLFSNGNISLCPISTKYPKRHLLSESILDGLESNMTGKMMK